MILWYLPSRFGGGLGLYVLIYRPQEGVPKKVLFGEITGIGSRGSQVYRTSCKRQARGQVASRWVASCGKGVEGTETGVFRIQWFGPNQICLGPDCPKSELSRISLACTPLKQDSTPGDWHWQARWGTLSIIYAEFSTIVCMESLLCCCWPPSSPSTTSSGTSTWLGSWTQRCWAVALPYHLFFQFCEDAHLQTSFLRKN